MVSALVPGASDPGSSPEDTVLCSWARHVTLTVPLSTQEYKWVPANPSILSFKRRIVGETLQIAGGMNCDGLASRPGGEEILPQKPGVSSGSYDPVGSKASFFFVRRPEINVPMTFDTFSFHDI